MIPKTFQKARNNWFISILSRRAILRSLQAERPQSMTPQPDAGSTQSDKAAQATKPQHTQDANHSHPSEAHKKTNDKMPSGDLDKIETDSFNRELYRVRAARLVDIFPDELVIREKSISVIRRDFLIRRVETWNIDDIGEVALTDTPLYSSLHVVGKFPEHKLDLHGIPKAKAIKAKEILDGLVLEDQEELDLPEDVDTEKRRSLLSQAGKLPEGSDSI